MRAAQHVGAEEADAAGVGLEVALQALAAERAAQDDVTDGKWHRKTETAGVVAA
jgi:hypothetical protein